MENIENDNKQPVSLLAAIQGRKNQLKKLASSAKNKNIELSLVDHCIIAMNSDPSMAADDIDDMDVICDKYYITENKSYLNPEEMIPKGICIYASGEVITASKMRDQVFNLRYFPEPDNISVHALINYEDGKIYQTLPWNYKGVHQFTELDDSYIGILICEANQSSLTNDPMADTFQSLVALVAYLCRKYGIVPNEETLLLHNTTGRIKDISSYWQGYYTNDEFISKVQETIKSGITAEELKANYYAL